MEPRLHKRPFTRPFLGQVLEGTREPQPLFETKEAARQYMEKRITDRRNAFIAEYRKGAHGSAVLTYEPALDREVYRDLQQAHQESIGQIGRLSVHESRPEQRERLYEVQTGAYQEALQGLHGYTKFQVETFIGERLNVGLSKYAYDIRDGVLYGQQMTEPLIAMIQRGRDTRDIIGKDVDLPRQEAEVKLFQQMQSVMGNPQTEIGTTILSFSPPGEKGSAYAHNFYDVFVLQEKDGVRFVEARRYASGLSVEESLARAGEIVPDYDLKMTDPVDAYLIGTPLILGKDHRFFQDPDAIHRFLQGDEKAMSYEGFQRKVLRDQLFSGMVQHYLDVLASHPEDKKQLEKTLNAIMNRADEVVGLRTAIVTKTHRAERHALSGRPLLMRDHIDAYNKQEVRKTSTGCGSSGSLGKDNGSDRLPSNLSPKRSAEVASGEDKYGRRTFECPSCHETNLRPYNEKIPACQNCGSEKVAC